jgi:hypothetical protein
MRCSRSLGDGPKPRGGLTLDARGGQRVIANHAPLLIVDDHVGTGRPAAGSLPRVAAQPDIQRRAAAVETFNEMRGAERFQVTEPRHYSGRGRRRRSTTGEISRAGRSTAVVNACHSEAESTNGDRSARTRSARSRPLSTRNSDSDSWVAAAASRNSSSSLAATRRCTRWLLVSAMHKNLRHMCVRHESYPAG